MSPGARDRKKAATADALHRAAMRLAVAHGLSNVTVEAIADEADVSRRTFSNYFANKEDAVLHGNRAGMRRMVEELRDRPADEPPWLALRRSVAVLFKTDEDPDPQWVAQTRLVRRQPSLHAAQFSLQAAYEHDLAEELGRRVRDPLRARLTAAAHLAAVRVGIDVWLERGGAEPLGVLVDRMIAQMGERFA
ncbi:MAG TPA: TetR family transcriptional regulator [Asanoa sp.]